MTCWWKTGSLVVKVGRDVVLKQFPKVLNDELGSTGVTVLTQSLVDSKDVDQFVSQVVFRTVATVQGDGWSYRDGRNWQYFQNNPFGSVLLVHTDENEMVGRDAAQPFSNITRVEFALS